LKTEQAYYIERSWFYFSGPSCGDNSRSDDAANKPVSDTNG